MKAIILCVVAALSLAFTTAIPTKIVGGSLTTISNYPSMVSMLNSWDGSNFWQSCGGTIINTRSILTAAHCVFDDIPDRWRARVGSTWANSGGTVHSTISFIHHPEYSILAYLDSDISIIRTASAITYVNNAVQPGTFAGPNYNTGDNAAVWAAGWGRIAEDGPLSEQLRHVQVYTINQAICLSLYGGGITVNMLCSGVLEVGGRDQCTYDSGSPVFHDGIVVGVCSWGLGCARPQFPGVNVRVSQFTNWIIANA